jgi:hypothetical protein
MGDRIISFLLTPWGMGIIALVVLIGFACMKGPGIKK